MREDTQNIDQEVEQNRDWNLFSIFLLFVREEKNVALKGKCKDHGSFFGIISFLHLEQGNIINEKRS